MYKPTLGLFFLLSFFGARSQQTPGENPFSSLPKLNVTIADDSTVGSFKADFSNIDVMDARPDSSTIGYIYSPHKRKRKQLVVEQGLEKIIHDWTNKYLQASNDITGDRLLIVIKRMRLGPEILSQKKVSEYLSEDFSGFAGISLKAEFYLNNAGNYYPLYRYDSVITYRADPGSYAGLFIIKALELSLQKIKTLDREKIKVKGRKMTLQEVMDYSLQSYNIPILKDKIALNRGVYRSFSEFTSNQPSIGDFTLGKNSLTQVLYIKENGVEFAIATAWGYCDGENIFIYSGNNYFRLFRIGNTFSFKGFRGLNPQLHEMRMPYNNGGGYKAYESFDKIYQVYQVDIETGKFY